MVPGAKHALACFVVLLLILCACEPEPTPLPSVLPTAQPTQGVDANATPAPLRYGIADVLLTYLSDQERSMIASSAEIIPLGEMPAQQEFGERYDFIVAPGDPFVPNGTFAPAPIQVLLLINIALSPLDDPALAGIVRRAVNRPGLEHTFSPTPMPGTAAPTLSAPLSKLETLRSELANAGYPDGFDLTLSSPFVPDPGIATLLANALMHDYGIELRLVAPDEAAHLTLTTVPTAPNADAVLLYQLPISYRAVDGLNITFTPSGFPIASR